MRKSSNLPQTSRRALRAVILAALLLTLPTAFPSASLAETTALTGNSQPHSTEQPSLAVNFIVRTEGPFQDLGEVMIFGGNFAPQGWAFAHGQELSINDNPALFSHLGTTYGGDGQATFALPDLRGRTPIGYQPSSLTSWGLGQTTGAATQTLSESQLPSHNHTMPAPNDPTTFAGGGQPINNMQPSLAMNYVISEQGIFPSRNLAGGGANLGADDAYIAAIGLYAGNSMPNNRFRPADGHLNQISGNTAMFALVGTTYGGNGQTTYAVPDLRGRTALHAAQGPGLSPRDLGEAAGAEQHTMSVGQMPIHDHKLPPTLDSTGLAGGSQPMNNMQPFLGLNYIIALEGIFPPRNLAESLVNDNGNLAGIEPFLGEIDLFAGNFAPRGWAMAEGQLLSISQNTALFSLLGTTYGGNGVTNFALPDLRGRIAIGMGQGPGLPNYDLGQMSGDETFTLSVNQMAAHDHDYTPVPEPSTLLLAACSALGLFVVARRKR